VILIASGVVRGELRFFAFARLVSVAALQTKVVPLVSLRAATTFARRLTIS
jgi:hypothetical protein